ncbi:MAG: hypothetical protein HRT47_05735 [Candidatus Caenarcaniphilales bacterium]|nr:hypothetical protein [Candidatus Caenarcaniphilales bacterium]
MLISSIPFVKKQFLKYKNQVKRLQKLSNNFFGIEIQPFRVWLEMDQLEKELNKNDVINVVYSESYQLEIFNKKEGISLDLQSLQNTNKFLEDLNHFILEKGLNIEDMKKILIDLRDFIDSIETEKILPYDANIDSGGQDNIRLYIKDGAPKIFINSSAMKFCNELLEFSVFESKNYVECLDYIVQNLT